MCNSVSVAPGSPCSMLVEKCVQSGGFEGRPGRHWFVDAAPETWLAVYLVWGAEAPAAVQGQQPLKVQQPWCSLFTDWGSIASL